MKKKGYLSLLLHAHLPYVRHPEHSNSLEERWFFESCTECYIPLLTAFERLVNDGVDFRLTVSLSPPLLSMMADDLLKERFYQYLETMIALGQSECERNLKNEFGGLAINYQRQLEEVKKYFIDCSGDLTAKFKELALKGRLELISSSATHAYLPLIHKTNIRRAQVEVGLSLFEKFFGQIPHGFWLPECGYEPGIDSILKEAGIKYFIVDTHGFLAASPEPAYGVYAPVQCRSGVAAFSRDPESSRQVWERRMGYPGHPDYREFYRDIAYDLDVAYLSPYLPGGSIKVDTGYKYYRITGEGDHKEVYKPEAALKRTGIHARDFVEARAFQLNNALSRMDRSPLIVAPYDAELFGHWWHEGPVWLENVLRQADSDGFMKTVSPGDYLALFPENQEVDLSMSSWGEKGYSYVWLNPKNDWIYRHQHVAETRMTEMVDQHQAASGRKLRALNQAGRELLLVQSSDWAFIMKEETTVKYARQRVIDHFQNFFTLAEQINNSAIDEKLLADLEKKNNIFPDLSFNVFGDKIKPIVSGLSRLKIIMLSWEYPPRTVGGLGRHVHDLSRALSGLGVEVHVFTCPAGGKPLYEVDDAGVNVYRMDADVLSAGDFMSWLTSLNAEMVKRFGGVDSSDGRFHLVHAHDWLVRDAAKEIAEKKGIPLVVTIHATEYGRNKGITTDFQRQIHGIENNLVSIASQVICCSDYMAREVGRLFGKAQGEIKVIPNGVNVRDVQVSLGLKSKINSGRPPKILFLGRLVIEKGVQVIIEAMPLIIERHPGTVLTVAGKGPYEGELRRIAKRVGVAEYVEFVGFVDDVLRNRLLAEASVAVFPSIYEPFGIVALEAMASGTPVVVSQTGGLAEIISHGLDGIKVPPDRPDLLAQYVIELLSHPGLAEKLGEKAYQKVLSRFDWNKIAFETAEVYINVVVGLKKMLLY